MYTVKFIFSGPERYRKVDQFLQEAGMEIPHNLMGEECQNFMGGKTINYEKFGVLHVFNYDKQPINWDKFYRYKFHGNPMMLDSITKNDILIDDKPLPEKGGFIIKSCIKIKSNEFYLKLAENSFVY